MNNTASCQLRHQNIADDNTLILSFSGKINLYNIQTVWQDSLQLVKQQGCHTVLIDLDALSTYDDALVHLLTKLHQLQAAQQKILRFKRNDYPIMPLYTLYVEKIAVPPQVREQWTSVISRLGHYIFTIFVLFKQACIFLGELCYKANSLKKYFARWIYELYQCGYKGVLIITLIGLLLGVILSFQGVIVLSTFGAQIYIVQMVVISLNRELVPIMTAFVVTGRSVAAFAAEIGAMNINQEIDALQTMNIDTTEFLILPKIAAVMVMMPLLNLYMLLFGFIGCGLVFLSLGYSVDLFYVKLAHAIRVTDLLGALLKTIVFGLVIASIGCINGLKARQGSTSVGMAATRSVVLSIIMITIIDGLFAVIYYNLGI